MIKKLLSLTILIIATLGLSAQTISGTVTDLNGAAIANQQVHIMNNDSMNPYSSSTYTTGSGAYSFANVPSSSMGFMVYTYDCQQNFQSVYVASNTGTANFTICTSNPTGCSAMFIDNPDTLNPLVINFMDLSTGNPTSWAWSFGDGTASSMQNPTHTYASNGSYSVSLVISSALCTDSISFTIYVGNNIPSCMAAFYYVPDSNVTNSVDFFDISTGSPTSWAWDFGDGSTATTQNPSHNYATQGNYNVTLSISAPNSGTMCTDVITQMIYVGSTINTYSLSGTVYANNNAIIGGVAGLFDVSNNTIVGASLIDSTGSYYFQYVPAGTYIIGAAADSNLLSGYANTYYGDVVFWSTATQVTVSGNQTGLDINLVAVPVTPGSGSISGTVGAGSKSSVENLSIILTDDNNSNEVVSITITDASGSYTFSNIADGTYKIWVEIPGKTATPITVTIEAGNTISSGNDFIITGNTIVPKPTSISNIDMESILSIYPNPVLDILNVEIQVENNTRCSFEIYSVSGHLIHTQYANLNTGSNFIRLNTNELAQGTYIIKIENSSNHTMQRLFVK